MNLVSSVLASMGLIVSSAGAEHRRTRRPEIKRDKRAPGGIHDMYLRLHGKKRHASKGQ